jgi:hypothetical protein
VDDVQNSANQAIARRRIVTDTIRLWKGGGRDLVMEISCALHNLRVSSRPQPLASRVNLVLTLSILFDR